MAEIQKHKKRKGVAMAKMILTSVMLLAAVSLLMGAANGGGKKGVSQEWQRVFDVNKADLADTGRNTYFILEPGYKLHFKHGKETLVITVLNETKVVDGVTTRVVEERETSKGQLGEISRNYYAIDRKTKAVYYFGEDVDNYKDGKVDNHEGSWLAGVNGNKFGLMIPAKPKVGEKFYQEQAPGVAMDRSEIVSITEKMKTPAGTYEKCLHAKDSSDLESGTSEKWYAPGVGLIKDDAFVLAKVEKPEKRKK
jgi:hypothetical protein